MTKIVSILFIMHLTGCSGLVVHKDLTYAPDLNEFPETGRTYEVAGTVDTARKNLIYKLNSLDVSYEQRIRGLDTFVVTSFVVETPSPYENREAVTAYSFEINEVKPGCSGVQLRWLVMSRGEFDAKWRILNTDKTYKPRLLGRINEYFLEKACHE